MDRRVSLVSGLVTSATRMRRCAAELEHALASRDDARLRAAATAAMWTLRSGACLRDACAELFDVPSCGAGKNLVDGSG